MMRFYHHAGFTPMMTSPYTIYNAFDRTRAMFDIPQIEVLTPIGKVVKPKTIEELCYDSAKKIVDNATWRKIVVTWSGGIDSTLVLSEILKIAPKKQVVVMMDENSIKEYPDYYKKYIEGQLETRKMNFYTDEPLRECLRDGVIVTGDLMDQLFGEDVLSVIPEYRLRQTIPEFLQGLNPYTQEMYTKLIDACPRPLESLKDFIWWMDYALQYQLISLIWSLEIEQIVPDLNLFHFPMTEDWNNYAVSTPAEIKWPGYDYRNYKQVLKDQLFTFTKDEYYTREKIKVPSYRRYRTDEQRERKKAIWINTDWKRGYLKR
jgi:hypothetical protein